MAGTAKRLWHRLTFNLFSSAGPGIDPPRDPPDPPGSPAAESGESETDYITDNKNAISKENISALKTSRKIMINSGSCMYRYCSCPRGYFLVELDKLPVDYPCVPNGGGLGGCGHTLSDHQTSQVSDGSSKQFPAFCI